MKLQCRQCASTTDTQKVYFFEDDKGDMVDTKIVVTYELCHVICGNMVISEPLMPYIRDDVNERISELEKLQEAYQKLKNQCLITYDDDTDAPLVGEIEDMKEIQACVQAWMKKYWINGS